MYVNIEYSLLDIVYVTTIQTLGQMVYVCLFPPPLRNALS